MWQERALEAFEFVGDAGASIALENLARTNLRLGRLEQARLRRDALVSNIERGEAFETFLKDIDMGLALAEGDPDTFDALAASFTEEDPVEMWAREDIAMNVWQVTLLAHELADPGRARTMFALLETILGELGGCQYLDLDEVARLEQTLAQELP